MRLDNTKCEKDISKVTLQLKQYVEVNDDCGQKKIHFFKCKKKIAQICQKGAPAGVIETFVMSLPLTYINDT